MTSCFSHCFGRRKVQPIPKITDSAELHGLSLNFEKRAQSKPVDYYYYRLKKHNLKRVNESQVLFARAKHQFILGVESVVSLCVIFNGYFCFINESDNYPNIKSTVILLIIQSALTLLSVVLMIIRIVYSYEIKRIRANLAKPIIPSKRRLLVLTLRVMAFMVHPNVLLLHKKAFEEGYLNKDGRWSYMQHNINDYLFLFQITCHMIHFVTWRLRESKFSSSSVRQMSQMIGFAHTYKFIIQSELRESPFKTMTKFYVFSVLLFTLLILITERPLIYATDAPEYNRDFFDIAMSFKYASTILNGTGEMVSGSILGKILTMVLGFMMVVFIKVTWEAYTREFEFNKPQKSVMLINQRLKFLEKLKMSAAEMIQFIWLTQRALRKSHESNRCRLMDVDETKFLILNFLLSQLAYEEALNVDTYDACESRLLAFEAALDELVKSLDSIFEQVDSLGCSQSSLNDFDMYFND